MPSVQKCCVCSDNMSIDKQNTMTTPKNIHYIMYHVISSLNGLGVYTT